MKSSEKKRGKLFFNGTFSVYLPELENGILMKFSPFELTPLSTVIFTSLVCLQEIITMWHKKNKVGKKNSFKKLICDVKVFLFVCFDNFQKLSQHFC